MDVLMVLVAAAILIAVAAIAAVVGTVVNELETIIQKWCLQAI